MGKKISFVISVFNEEKSLIELVKQIKNVLKQDLRDYKYEIIFVNDGSTDDSLEVLKRLEEKNPEIKIFSFEKNLGKATALRIGFKKAVGDFIVTMDSDLQDGSENIPGLLQKINTGYDLVVGWRKKRTDPISKIIPSIVFNFFVRNITKIPLHDFNSGLKVMRVSVAKQIYLYGELHRFIPILAFQKGFKITELIVTHHPRKYGLSKYGKKRFIKSLFVFFAVMFKKINTFKTKDDLLINYQSDK